MITASLVLYKSKPHEVKRVIECVDKSIISTVYVVDNSPSDDLRELVCKSSSKAVYLFGQGNVGYGEGNNIGMKKAMEAGSLYHAILNPDIIFEAEVIVALTEYLKTHEDVGLIKPEQENPNNPFNTSAKLLPTPFITFGRRFLPRIIVDKINRRYELQTIDLTKARNVPNFSGSFLYFKMSVLNEVGLFDTRYLMYFEDFDLVRRFHKVSKTVFYPHVKIVHAHNAEHRRNKKLLLMGLKSGIKYYNKWGWIFDSDRNKWNKETFTKESVCE